MCPMQCQGIDGQGVRIFHSMSNIGRPNIALWPTSTSYHVAIRWELNYMTIFRIVVFFLRFWSISMNPKELKGCFAFERLEFLIKDIIMPMVFTWFWHGEWKRDSEGSQEGAWTRGCAMACDQVGQPIKEFDCSPSEQTTNCAFNWVVGQATLANTGRYWHLTSKPTLSFTTPSLGLSSRALNPSFRAVVRWWATPLYSLPPILMGNETLLSCRQAPSILVSQFVSLPYRFWLLLKSGSAFTQLAHSLLSTSSMHQGFHYRCYVLRTTPSRSTPLKWIDKETLLWLCKTYNTCAQINFICRK